MLVARLAPWRAVRPWAVPLRRSLLPHAARAMSMRANGTPPSAAGPEIAEETMAAFDGESVPGLLRSLVAENTELREQLRVQNDLSRRRNEMLQENLRSAANEREELRNQVKSLTGDFHVLAEKFHAENMGGRPRIQRKGVEGKGAQSRMAYRPDEAYAMRQPTHTCELPHQSLAELAMLGNHCARRERLLREVMCVDGISWGQAHDVLKKLDTFNEKFYWFETMPYRIGIAAAFLGGVGSILLVFWAPVAEWYGINVAGEELPEEVKSISEMTTNQVGTWTWGWMEPMIGTASFVLLCAQFVRAQGTKMNMQPYNRQLLEWRASRIAKAFPRYDESMLRAWASHMPKCNVTFFPTYERNLWQKGPPSGL